MLSLFTATLRNPAPRICIAGALLLTSTALFGCASYAFSSAKKEDSIGSYREFLESYPKSPPFSGEARDRLSFLSARWTGKAPDYERYLRDFPDGLYRVEAAAAVHLKNVVADHRASLVAKLVMLKRLQEEYGGKLRLGWRLRSFLDRVRFSRHTIPLIAEKYISTSSFRPMGVDVYSSSTVDVYGSVIMPGEIVYRCSDGLVRTMYTLPSDAIDELLDDERFELLCDEEDLISYRRGEEAFGYPESESDSRKLFRTDIPREFASEYAPARRLGQRRNSRGLASELLRSASAFAEEHPVATRVIVTGIMSRYEKHRAKKRGGAAW